MRQATLARRVLAPTLGLAGALALMGGSSAMASTLDVNANGTLTYTGASGLTSDLSLDEPTAGGGTVTVTRNGDDNDPVTNMPTGCTDTSLAAGASPGTVFTCMGVQRVLADAGDNDDTLDASAATDNNGMQTRPGLVTIPATLIGGAGNDLLLGGAVGDTIDGGAGNDAIDGGAGDNVITGGAGDDGISAGSGSDRIDAGDGNDSVDAGDGNNVVAGGAGDDFLGGGDGNDAIDGGAGRDTIFGGAGNDALRGGAGDDLLDGGSGTDDISGGEGFDTVEETATDSNDNPVPVSVTLDDQANDGAAGENDNVRTDVESVTTFTSFGAVSGAGFGAFFGGAGSGPDSANDTIVGDAGANDLAGGDGNDTITGGAGSDVLTGGAGDDTLNAVDGFPDFVSCGDGNDTANVDQFDTVSSECEHVNLMRVASATQDRPPTVSLTAPADGVTLSPNKPVTLSATASDDQGVTKVVFLSNNRVVCTVTAAPYTCSYQPTGTDVGRTSLVAEAFDTGNQAGFSARTVTFKRFAPRGLTIRTTPKRDARRPYSFTTTGRLLLPSGVTPATGCRTGYVAVQFKAGTKTISTRRAFVKSNCTYRSHVTFNLPRRLRPRRLRVVAAYSGNGVLAPRRTAFVHVRAG